MTPATRNWWKGSFPSWMVAGLLAVNVFFVKRYIESTDAAIKQLVTEGADRGRRLAAMETTVIGQAEAIKELKDANRTTVEELRQINRDLRMLGRSNP